MAYSTSTATSLSGFITSLVSFLTSNGWTSWDTLSSTDVIVKAPGNSRSTGTNAAPYYVRIQDANESGEELLDGHLGYGISTHDYFALNSKSNRKLVSFRMYQYWNNSTHSGSGELTGQIGPYMIWTRGVQSSHLFFNKGMSPSNLLGDEWAAGWDNGALMYPGDRSRGNSGRCPRMRMIDFQKAAYYTKYYAYYGEDEDQESSQVHFWEPLTYNTRIPNIVYNAAYYSCGAICPVIYDGEYYCFFALPESSHRWYKFGMEPGGADSTKMADPPADIAYNNDAYGSELVWDGGDYIYALRTQYTSFYRYSISGDSWTTLSSAPRTQYYGRLVYRPASETGHTNDRIYYFGPDSGSYIYYYDVTTASWSSDIGNLYDSSSNGIGGCHLNGSDLYVYQCPNATGNNTYGYWDTVSHTGTTIGSVTPSSGYCPSFLYVHRYCSDIHVNEGEVMTYHFFCDDSHFKVATKLSNDKWYYAYVGAITTNGNDEYVKTTALSGTGVNVSVTTDGTLPDVQIGGYLTVVDPTSDYKAQLQVINVDTNELTFASVSVAIPSGSIIGEDPAPYGLFSQNASVWIPSNFPLLTAVETGFQPWYDVRPEGFPTAYEGPSQYNYQLDQVLLACSNTANQRMQMYQLLPMKVRQTRGWMPEIQEHRGTLTGVYAFSGGDAVSGDTIVYDGKSYLVLVPADQSPAPQARITVCIGPME